MTRQENRRRHDILVVGAGQAGLAAGYYLQQHGFDFAMLDGHEHVGDSWRRRWASLELFTPAAYNGLPGMPFPAPAGHLPTKDEMADFLDQYARRFDLPLQMETWVTKLTRRDSVYRLDTDRGVYEAGHVIVATGAYQKQRVPAFAAELDPDIVQVRSSRYRTPAQLPPGQVLVVGAGNSGAQIALDVAGAGRAVWLSGRDTGHMKRTILGKDLFWWLYRTLFKIRVDTWLGRRLRAKLLGQGAALLDITEEELAAAGIRRVPRIAGVRQGLPVTAGGEVLNPDAVIWATGYRPDFGWIDRPVFAADGYPEHERGVVPGEPGLYFLGLPFLHRGNSSLIGGVGADARHVVDVLAARRARRGAPSAAAGDRFRREPLLK